MELLWKSQNISFLPSSCTNLIHKLCLHFRLIKTTFTSPSKNFAWSFLSKRLFSDVFDWNSDVAFRMCFLKLTISNVVKRKNISSTETAGHTLKDWNTFCVAFMEGLFLACFHFLTRWEQSIKHQCLIVVKRHLISKTPFLFVLKANACSKNECGRTN